MEELRFEGEVTTSGQLKVTARIPVAPGPVEVIVVPRPAPPSADQPDPRMRLAGTLPDEDAAEMIAAINEDCERVDADGW